MKKTILLFSVTLLAITSIFAQAPTQFKYQAVLRDAGGEILSSENVTVDIAILQGSASGTSVFSETHNLTTTAQGLINLNIGSAADLSVVDFSADTYFIEIIIDGTLMGTSQLLSVPYALQAKEVENVDYTQITNTPAIPEDVADLTDNSSLLFSRSYNDLTSTPTLFSGSFTDLSNTPTTIAGYGITDAFDGQYNSLAGTPIIPTDLSDLTDNTTLLFDGDYNSLSNLPTLFDGDYNSLSNLPTLFSGSYTDLTNKPDFTGWDTDASNDFSGAYGDLTGTPTIPTDLSDLTDNTTLLFDGDYNSLSNLPTLFDGDYNSLSNLPTLFSGSYTDLTNKPDFTGWDTDASNDFSGAYGDLTGTPTIPTDLSDLTDNTTLLFDGDYNSLSNLPTLFDGDYNSLSNLPTLFSGSYTDLTNKPDFTGWDTDASNDFSGAYGDLTGTPTIPTDLSDLTDNTTLLFDGDYNSLSNLPTLFDGDYNSLSNLPTLFSGSYTDLTNKPTITDDQTLAEVLTENNSANAQIKNVTDPTDDQDAATKAYVDLLEARIDAIETQMILNEGVTDIDGNKYEVVKIGNQIWMAEDLKVSKYPNGDAIPYIDDDATWGALADDNTSDAYSFYGDSNNDGTVDIANPDYGALYTYAAAIGDSWTNDNTTGQGVCPDGWHLPTDTEWTELTDYLGGAGVAGGKIKEIGTTHWNSPNEGATNESGFAALPGGNRHGSNGSLYSLGNFGHWWSATEYGAATAWTRYLDYDASNVYRNYNNKSYGFSVRCLRD